jgi:cyanophycin synthetase
MSETPIQILRVVSTDGYYHGVMQPTLNATIAVPVGVSIQLTQRFNVALAEIFGPRRDVAPACDLVSDAESEVLHSLGYWTLQMSHDVGFPMLGEHRLTALPPVTEVGEKIYLLLLPCLTARPMEQIFRHLVTEMQSFCSEPDRVKLSDDARKALDTLIEELRPQAPVGTNNTKFLAAAHELGIPYLPLPGGLYQYGWGSRGRLMSSSTTDATGVIAATTARNKLTSGMLLRQAGMPVPTFGLVRTADAAASLAERIGFPVVVKPADLDGGVGVSVWLRNSDQVRLAFDKARARSSNILVQKYVDAPEHRLNVFNGRLIGAALRLPAGVTGDGQSTVSELVEKANADPTRKPHKRDGAAPLMLGQAEIDLLDMQGLRIDAVPAERVFVRLAHETRRGTGGTTETITERVHPDNAALAVQAASLLRLDIAGIDLLCPDISRSWKEVGAAITEINSAPQYGEASGSLPRTLLQQLIAGRGRIPVILALDMAPEALVEFADRLSGNLKGDRRKLAVSLPNKFLDSDGWVAHQRGSALQGARMILMRPTTDVALISMTSSDILRSGLPVDMADVLIIDDLEAPSDVVEATVPKNASLENRLRILAGASAHISGSICLRTHHSELERMQRLFGPGKVYTTPSADALAKAIAGSLVASTPQVAA